MADHSKIEWTDATWNWVTGCDKVSEGCLNCYIERTPPFRITGRRFDRPGIGGSTGVLLHPDRIVTPLSWRKPRKVFVNSLADVFHEAVPDEMIARAWAVMALTPRHSYQILTKRPARMRSLLNSHKFQVWTWAAQAELRETCLPDDAWPLPNVWLGVSVENQKWADIRIPALLDTPASVRFLSCEPLLGPVDLYHYTSWPLCEPCMVDPEAPLCDACYGRRSVNWVIVGGESGPGARPMHPDWARSLRDRCTAAGVPFHFKQWGEWSPSNDPWRSATYDSRPAVWITKSGATKPWDAFTGNEPSATKAMYRVGKKAAGRSLDGRTWDEFPEVSR